MALIDKDRVMHNLDDTINIDEYTFQFSKEENKKIRIVFMGTPSFAVPILEGLIQNYEVVLEIGRAHV